MPTVLEQMGGRDVNSSRLCHPHRYKWIAADSPDVSKEVFEEILEHVRNYKTVWQHQIVTGILRYMKLPRWRR